MNKLFIDWILCILVGIIPGIYLYINWKIGILFLFLGIIFHIWRWKNWNKIYNALVGVSE
jgi:hypothetical protein